MVRGQSIRRFLVAVAVAAGSVGAGSAEAALKGSVRLDGSSTVFPISAAVAEEFNREKDHAGVKVTVAYSGTGGGFKKWCAGETDINNASRKIKDKEAGCAKKNGIAYLEMPVAYDGISVVVSRKNTFINQLTLEQLKELWKPGSPIRKWKQLNAQWPDEEVKLYGPGTDSGTFDYFTEEVVGTSRASRSDYVASEDDNVLVKGVSASPHALGYFGHAYYEENQRSLRAVPLVGGKGKAVAPENATIKDGSYPLSRPVFLYVSSKAVERPEVQAFVEYYLKQVGAIAKQVGYTPLAEEIYRRNRDEFAQFVAKHGKKAASTPANGKGRS